MESAASRLLLPNSLPELGPRVRAGVVSQPQIDSLLNPHLDQLPGSRRDLVRALVYLWNDHLDASHQLAQSIDNPDGSYVHAIMHRREPDYGNAKYWFRRVGNHRIFAKLAKQAAQLGGTASNDLIKRFVAAGRWDPFGFVDACEEAASNAPARPVLEQLQAAEFALLLEEFVSNPAGGS